MVVCILYPSVRHHCLAHDEPDNRCNADANPSQCFETYQRRKHSMRPGLQDCNFVYAGNIGPTRVNGNSQYRKNKDHGVPRRPSRYWNVGSYGFGFWVIVIRIDLLNFIFSSRHLSFLWRIVYYVLLCG